MSISEETPASVCSGSFSPPVKLVKKPLICRPFRVSIIRISIALTWVWVPLEMKLVIGSSTTRAGFRSSIARSMDARCISNP